MRENPVYQKFLSSVSVLSRQEVLDLSKDKIGTTTDIAADTLSDAFVENMKNIAADDIQKAQLQTAVTALQSQLEGGGRLWFRNNFPQAQYTGEMRDGKRCVVICLDDASKDGGPI
jgi:hypothetical protein